MPFLTLFSLQLRPSEARHSLPRAWVDLCPLLSISDRKFGPLQADALSFRRLERRSEGAGARTRQLQLVPGAEAGVHPAPARPSPGQARPPPRATPSEPPGLPVGLRGGSRPSAGPHSPMAPSRGGTERGSRGPSAGAGEPSAGAAWRARRGGAGGRGAERRAAAGGGEQEAPDGASPRDGACPRWVPPSRVPRSPPPQAPLVMATRAGAPRFQAVSCTVATPPRLPPRPEVPPRSRRLPHPDTRVGGTRTPPLRAAPPLVRNGCHPRIQG